MHYPWWYVPHLTAPLLIAAISVVHVLVSHYAVGGGLFLAIETGYAHRKKDQAYLEYLHSHARFFLLLTVVFGAISGVGIWWTIGLASPLSTEVLLRTFLFGWAMEYAFFLLEIVSLFIFYYYWQRLPPATHTRIGWIYGLSAWASLVLITGITSFMLHPGSWLTDRGNFWAALLNPQFIPQVIARTGGALLLSSLYVYLHSSVQVKERRLHDLIQARSARPALLGAVLIAVGGAVWYIFLPDSARAVLQSAGALNVLMGLIFLLTVVVFFLIYLGPYRNPGWISPGFAAALLVLGLIAFSTGEFIREAVRKPYIIYNVVLGNQVFPEQVAQLKQTGFLEGGVWTKAYMKAKFPQTLVDGRISSPALLKLSPADRIAVGAVLFQHHCNDCHAAEQGYSAVTPMLRGRTPAMVQALIEHLEMAHFFMPPWSGTSEEAQLLTDYLMKLTPARPAGMLPAPAPAENRP
jgi:cytochrome bd-type quinol oxidase subunit 1